MAIEVYSEIGKLKKVLLHRPGRELENLVPAYMDRMLFDDIPYVAVAQQEHDFFAAILRDHGAEVVYVEQLLARVLADGDLRQRFVRDYILDAGVTTPSSIRYLCDYFSQYTDTLALANDLIAGLRKEELATWERTRLIDYLTRDYPFIIDPLPNLYFTRDAFACAGNGASLHHMQTLIRHRETRIGEYVLRYHPDFAGSPLWYTPQDEDHIEGGDILVLSDQVIAVGLSQRTQPAAVERYARRILASDCGFRRVLVIDIPKERSFMHLDTVFTQVDRDAFVVHPNIRGDMKIFCLTWSGGDSLHIQEEHRTLEAVLAHHLGLDRARMLHCGGGSSIDADREQWNDGSNTLSLAPGLVVLYARNYTTNRILEENGINICVMPSSELSRGRGGPRCMSMPLVRERL